MKDYNEFINPLNARYASEEMSHIFSPQFKFSTWRRLWIALAEAQKDLGLPISDSQIAELKKYKDDINFAEAEEREKTVRHDVMSHIYAYGLQAKEAAGIIHLGATSAYVGDNTDLIQARTALALVCDKLVDIFRLLSDFALEYKALPTLGFTHLQPAQLTTVGKRATLWLQDFYLDYLDVRGLLADLPFLGVKGTTGTQASFLELFDKDADKVAALEISVARKLDFDKTIAVSGQTYTRKLDYKVCSVLSGIAQSASKMTNDIRLLQHMKEVEEPFETKQIGSSAMAYKRNPMRSERVAALSRFIMSTPGVAAATEATQWFERTLDDSAAKRIVIPEAFLATDSILDILRNISSGLVVNEKVIYSHIMAEIPFMATENILMEAVKRGGDRQKLHERIREHSMQAASIVKQEGKPNDLLERIAGDLAFGLSYEDIESLLDPSLYIGLSASQTENFIKEDIAPIIDEKKPLAKSSLKV